MSSEPAAILTGSPHPDVTRVLAAFTAAGVPTYDRIGVLRSRAVLENVTRSQAPAVPVAEVKDILVAGAARSPAGSDLPP